MATYTVYRTSAFTDASNGGNEAGVSLDAASMDTGRMQALAKAIGYSETVFVQKIEHTDIHVRYFTPEAEVPLCGHATIALLNLLRHLKLITPGEYTLHTPAGPFPVKVLKNRASLLFSEPRILKTFDKKKIARMLSLREDTIASLPITSIDAGVRELYIGLKHAKTMKDLSLCRDALLEVSAFSGVSGVVFYTEDAGNALADVRNFLPAIGIEEESATGTAAAALTKLLHDHTGRFEQGTIIQGMSLGKPSRIDVRIDALDSVINTIEISGKFRVIDTVDVTL